jgi:hypothetical protein
MSPLDESGQFSPRPHTQADYVRETYRLVTEEVIPRQDKTNSRISTVEKFMWALGGGLAVIGAIVVPQFLNLTR